MNVKINTDGIFHGQCETPVVFFIYNRPYLVEKTFASLRDAQPKQLLIVSDGPKNSAEDELLVNESRRIVQNVDWDCDVKHLFSSSNLGLRERILTGLDEAFRIYHAAIILEDDCMPAKDFFPFCEVLLSRYQNTDVGLVSGFNNGAIKSRSRKYFFSDFPEIWGWATWAETWKEYREVEVKRDWSELELKSDTNSLNSRIARNRISRLARVNLTLNSWDVEFAMYLIKKRKLSAIPKVNLILNQGFGHDATHTKHQPPGLINKTGSLRIPLIEPKRISARRFQHVREFMVLFLRSLYQIVRNPFIHIRTITNFVREKLARNT
jgi:hypothetical protein